MHELSLAMDLVDLLTPHGKTLQRITSMTLALGSLSCVDEQALRTALDSALKGTLAEGATIHVQHITAQAQCGDCQTTYEPPTRLDPCPHCGSFRKNWLQGQEFRLQSIEGEPHSAR